MTKINETPETIAGRLADFAEKVCSTCVVDGQGHAIYLAGGREAVVRYITSALRDAEWNGYINGAQRIANFRPPSSYTHDGANTLNEIRLFSDQEILHARDELKAGKLKI